MNFQGQNFQEVSHDVFFSTVGKMNVHPNPGRMQSVWERLDNRQVVGISTPGYMGVGERKYFTAPQEMAA